MLLRITTVLATVALVFTTACASKAPEPIYAEPTFNKYGEPSCVPDRPPVQQPGTFAAAPTYPPELPPCCPVGYTVSQDGRICLPPPEREPNDDPTDIPGRPPTGGITAVAG